MKQFLASALALVAALTALPLYAGAWEDRIDAGFTVSPVLPENQSDPEAGYFDLLVRPGQEQELAVAIENPNDYPIAVQVEAIAASTNRNGLVLYSSPGIYDESMTFPFSQLAEVAEETMEIAPNSSERAAITLTMPEEAFDGMILGAVRVLRLPDESELQENGVTNQFSYAIAVRLRETDAVVLPEFSLGDAGMELVNYKAALFVHIRNSRPLLVQGMDVAVEVLQDGETVIAKALEDVDIAPNSVFPFTLTDEQGYGFAAGEYTANVRLDYQDQVWELTRDFTVEAALARDMNGTALNQFQQQPKTSRSPALYAVAGAVLAAASLSLILLRRKRRS